MVCSRSWLDREQLWLMAHFLREFFTKKSRVCFYVFKNDETVQYHDNNTIDTKTLKQKFTKSYHFVFYIELNRERKLI